MGIQSAIRNVGAVLAGRATGRGGRKLGWIEQATELVLVAQPVRGSVELELELESEPLTLDVNERDLGPLALRAFVEGVAHLGPAGPLPTGFDPGVLRAISGMSPVFAKGYHGIEITLGRDTHSREACITSERLQVVRALTARPLIAPASVEGVFIAVDLAGDPLACRIDRPFSPSVACLIPREMRAVVKSLIEHQVEVEGVGEFAPGADEPQRIRVEHLRGSGPEDIDRTAWRAHRAWQELALQQGTERLQVAELPTLFDDDDDLALFLAAAHGQTVE